MTYQLEIGSFTGPLDLLYKLIKEKEIEITEISLARVTNQYLSYLRQLEKFNLDLASEFTVIGAELIEIKARRLLPGYDEDEEEETVDLVARLKEHRIIKELAACLDEMQQGATCFHYPDRGQEFLQENYILEIEEDIDKIYQLYCQVMEAYEVRQDRQDEREKLIKMAEQTITLQEKIDEIMTILTTCQSGQQLVFEEFISRQQDRLEVVITLLSLLELTRMKKIRMRQQQKFGRIMVSPYQLEQKEETANA